MPNMAAYSLAICMLACALSLSPSSLPLLPPSWPCSCCTPHEGLGPQKGPFLPFHTICIHSGTLQSPPTVWSARKDVEDGEGRETISHNIEIHIATCNYIIAITLQYFEGLYFSCSEYERDIDNRILSYLLEWLGTRFFMFRRDKSRPQFVQQPSAGESTVTRQNYTHQRSLVLPAHLQRWEPSLRPS